MPLGSCYRNGRGSVTNAKTDLALAVTGVAGPGGGTSLKPVGLVL